MRRQLILIPLMLCLAACHKIEVGAPPPPDERLACENEPGKPEIKALVAFQAFNGALVYQKADVDARDAKIAEWIVKYRGAWFSCSSQLKWNRDYKAGNR